MGFSNIKDIVKEIEKIAQEGLKTKVADDVKKVIIENASKGVYEAYNPSVHIRQNRLSNESNLQVDSKNKYVSIYYIQSLGYYDMEERYSQSISSYIPTDVVLDRFASGEVWGPNNTLLKPSPFFKNAKDEVLDKKIHIKSMKNYLSQYFTIN